MKTLIVSIALFLTVGIFVTLNTFFLQKLFGDISSDLKSLPQNIEQIQQLSENQTEKHKETLNKIVNKWQKHEKYIYVALEHSTAARFNEYFLPTKEYFFAKDYESYLASLETVQNILSQFKTNEGVTLENIF